LVLCFADLSLQTRSKDGEVMKPAIAKSAGNLRAVPREAEAPARSDQSPSQSPMEEPRTSVVRRVDPRRAAARHQSVAPRSRAWRCLESAQPAPRSPSERDPSISIAQVSTNGERLRHSGPDEWLPEAAEFVHRAALLVAHDLGFERCLSVCLRGPTSVLSVSDAGPTTIMSVAGPVAQLSNVLRKRGIK
jgi:hypothetical protein